MVAVWWTVALSEEVSRERPLQVDIGDQPLVLWRDAEGAVRVLEDRCPHRRAPLSLGCVRPNGWLQCGYHGWSFDGSTGRLMEIPNMKDDQRFPPLYRARRFAANEGGGFVRVSLDSQAEEPCATLPLLGWEFSGTSHVALDHRRYLEVLFDDPGLLLELRGVGFTPYLLSDLRTDEGVLTMERQCEWGRLNWPAPFRSNFPISLLISSDPVTGESELVLRDRDLVELFKVRMAPVPQARGITAIRWRATALRKSKALRARLLRMGTPFAVRDTIDAAAIRTLKPTVSSQLSRLATGSQQQAVAA